VRALLDSNALLWFIAEPAQLARRARDILSEDNTEAFVSVASLWELSIKAGLGKLTLPPDLLDLIADSELALLAIEPRHAMRVAHLPRLHGDPFDRLLIAQAIIEDLVVVTRDRTFAAYGLPVIPA